MLLQISKNTLDIYQQIRDMTSELAREVVRPKGEKLDRDAEFPVDIFRQMANSGFSVSRLRKSTVEPELIATRIR